MVKSVVVLVAIILLSIVVGDALCILSSNTFACNTNFVQVVQNRMGKCGRGASRVDSMFRVGCWSGTSSPLEVPNAITARSLSRIATSIDSTYTCGQYDNGAVTCWGPIPSHYAHVRGLTDWNYKYLSVYSHHAHPSEGYACVVKPSSDRFDRVICVGSNSHGKATPPSGYGYRFSDLSTGPDHACALDRASGESWGRVVCWGKNTDNQLTFPKDLKIIQIVVSDAYTCGLIDDTGRVHCVGRTSGLPFDSFPTGRTYLQFSASGGTICAIRSETRSIDCKSSSSSSSVENPPPGEYWSVSVFGLHACAITTTDKLVCWGNNNNNETALPPCFCKNDCNGAGECVATGVCSCYPGYVDKDCRSFTCKGVLPTAPEETVCSGRGKCIAADTCKCNTGFAGKNCETDTCYGIAATDEDVVCSGHGKCTSLDTCLCDEGYLGKNCSGVLSCAGIISTDPLVCRNRGRCIKKNTCVCVAGYHGNSCEYSICDGYSSQNPSVCNGFGKCVAPDVCECKSGYTGKYCATKFGIDPATEQEGAVCSGHGKYIDSKCDCDEGYSGKDCEIPSCHGIPAGNKLACRHRGQCIKKDICECSAGFHGNLCEYSICDGYSSTHPSVCNGFGKCVAPDVCECKSGYTGRFCGSRSYWTWYYFIWVVSIINIVVYVTIRCVWFVWKFLQMRKQQKQQIPSVPDNNRLQEEAEMESMHVHSHQSNPVVFSESVHTE